MKLLVEIPEKTYEYAKYYRESHILSLRDNSICMDAIRDGQPLPEDCEILTKEAYEDLCMRASKCEE